MAAATSAIFTLKLATGYTACASAGGFVRFHVMETKRDCRRKEARQQYCTPLT